MNIERLKQVKQCILAEPTQFHMNQWVDVDYNSSCGTTACIAGWAAYLFDKEYKKGINRCGKNQDKLYEFLDNNDTEEIAERVLEFDDDDYKYELFYDSHWPEHFRNKIWYSSSTAKEHAAAAASYIDYVIEDVKRRKESKFA